MANCGGDGGGDGGGGGGGETRDPVLPLCAVTKFNAYFLPYNKDSSDF